MGRSNYPNFKPEIYGRFDTLDEEVLRNTQEFKKMQQQYNHRDEDDEISQKENFDMTNPYSEKDMNTVNFNGSQTIQKPLS